MPKHKQKSKDEQELDAIQKSLRESKRQYKALRVAEESAGIDLEARARENKERAAEMGLSKIEYGLLKYAHLQAELSAKADETLEETQARAEKLWRKEVEEWRTQEKNLMDAIMSLPEKERRKMLAGMRSRM